MKLKGIASLAALALVAGALFAPGIATAAKKKKAPKGPVVIGTDEAGDWGVAVDPTLPPVGDALGQDITEAAIELVDGSTLNFIITLNSLPATGGVPEISRYNWTMLVDGEEVELDGKFTNYSRGTCDPTSGACPPPRDPGLHPFFVRGNCGVAEGTNVTLCEELGIVEATFDAAAATITIPVPLELINAKKGSKIGPGAGLFGGTVEAQPSAFFTSGSMPSDSLITTTVYTIPKK
jgi:hypothetical protein